MPQNFPQIGLRAILELTGFSSNARKYIRLTRDIDRASQKTAQSVTRSGQQIGSGFAQNIEELIQKSRILENALQSGGLSAQSFSFLSTSLNELGQGIGLNVEKFDKLIESGATVGEAFQQAQGPIESLADSVNILGRNFTTSAVAISGATAVLGASIALVRRSISEYNDLAEATRRLRFQTGLLSEEASGWVLAAQASGLGAATSQRALTGFLSKVVDLRRDLESGKEVTNDFARALETLEVNLQNSDGTLKTTAELLADVEAGFRRLGPGALSAEAATSLFGFSGRFLLPLLQSTGLSLTKLTEIAEEYGGTLNSLSQKEYEEFKRSQFELLVAFQGVYNFIAKQWIPILTQVQRNAALYVSIWRTVVQILSGTEPVVRTLSERMRKWGDTLERVNTLLQKAAELAQFYRDVLDPAGALVRALAQGEEKLAQARGRASQAAAEAADREKKRRESIEETLDSLGELRSKMADKLEDIDRDAERAWDDILVKRFRDAADRQLQEVRKLDDLRAALNDKLDAIDQDFAKRWDDILVKRMREAIVRGIRLAQQYEALARSVAKSRSDAIRDAEERGAEQRFDVQRKIEDAERDARSKHEKLEREHYRRLRDIQQDYLDTVTEAARSNDAVAVARAMRERAREIRDEQTRFGDEQQDLARALSEKRADIERDRQEREQDQRNELAKTLRRIEENYAEQKRELARKSNEDAALRAIQHKWELDDFNKAKAEQKIAANDWYIEQRKDLIEAQEEAAEDRVIAYNRQLADFNKAQRRKMNDARAWYVQERNDLASHLNLVGYQLELAYQVWIGQAAATAGAIARILSSTVSEEIQRYQQYLPKESQPNLPPGVRAIRLPDGTYVDPTDLFPDLFMAEGGVVQANSPTHVMMGEGGPETAVFLPGNAQSMSVNHSFGRMGVDFEGLPGGMNTQQVESIVYAVMAQFAKGIKVPRN